MLRWIQAQGLKLLGALVALLLVALGVCWFFWNRAADARDIAQADLKEANATIALLEVDISLKEAASQENRVDDLILAETKEELIDAIQSTPDGQPSAVRVALGCKRLLQSGRTLESLPESCRSGS